MSITCPDRQLEMDSWAWPELPIAEGDAVGSIVDHSAGRNRYTAHLISLALHSFKSKRVALDCANGNAWAIAPSTFWVLGAEVHVINDRPNGLNINLNAGSTPIEGLKRFVKGMDVGFTYDGDVDRCLAVDENGELVDGNRIMYIYACYMAEQGKLLTNTVVTTVMSNFGPYKALDAKGIGYAKTAVGDKHICEYLTEHGCRISGEQSGHAISPSTPGPGASFSPP